MPQYQYFVLAKNHIFSNVQRMASISNKGKQIKTLTTHLQQCVILLADHQAMLEAMNDMLHNA